MHRVSRLIVIAFVFVPFASAQYGFPYVNAINDLVPMGYSNFGISSIGAGGATIALTGGNAAALINPAGIDARGITVDIEQPFRVESTGPYDLQQSRSAILPSLFTAAIPIGAISLQAGAVRTFDSKNVFPRIIVTTAENPDGTGEYLTASWRSTVTTLFTGASLRIGDDVTIGAMLGGDVVHVRDEIGTHWSERKGTKFRFGAGIIVRPLPWLSFGGALRYSTTKQLVLTTNITPVSGSRPFSAYAPFIPQYRAASPTEIEAGTSVRLAPDLSVSFALHHEQWADAFSGGSAVWQFKAGAEYAAAPWCTLRAGFFTKDVPNFLNTQYFDQKFLTAGATAAVSDAVSLSVAWLSSSVFIRDVPRSLYYYGPDRSLGTTELQAGISVGIPSGSDGE